MYNSIREESLEKLNDFISNGLKDYSKLRNYDFGQTKRTNVSNLSPFIRKRIIHEKEVIRECLDNFNYQHIEKFIQEVFWRAYWKGWLEGRTSVWSEYKKNLINFKTEFLKGFNNKNYEQAINGRTGIECFDDWVNELINYGYLHNHSRMWFASIWIHTLQLPWELGADFFIRNLLDGDPASNTLSWRWVAGFHTKGKNYIADEANIKKFTLNKYKQENVLNKNIKPPEFDLISYLEKKTENEILDSKNTVFLININNLSFLKENLDLMLEKKVCFVNQISNLEYSELQFNFIRKCVDEYLTFLKTKSIDCEIFSNYKEFNNYIDKSNYKHLCTFYPSIGYELDLINSNIISKKVKLNFIYDRFDQICWKFCSAGFFKFKVKIPSIIQKLI